MDERLFLTVQIPDPDQNRNVHPPEFFEEAGWETDTSFELGSYKRPRGSAMIGMLHTEASNEAGVKSLPNHIESGVSVKRFKHTCSLLSRNLTIPICIPA
ncbi:hypothetical protein GJ744_005114 [Endocarpon pusillum]|uniref:Uncharacterized protein n=1 Tax=Endocarpon pusillum TaxID=364733 RepID=A0A8H7ANE9_9EURO|nr:hypothetical protein GJ744_005114 [Endocarpon pusillum]